MSESVRRNVIPVLVTAVIGLFGWLLQASMAAGALDQRVKTLEQRQAQADGKLDRLLAVQQETREIVIRIQTKMESEKR